MSTTMAMKPENKRYLIRIGVAMVIYLASLYAAETLIEDKGLGGPPAFALASIPGLCLAAIFWLHARLIVEEQDEFLRLLYVRQSLVATGIALTAAAVWGFLEKYLLVAHVEALWWPTIWCFATAVGGVYNRITYGPVSTE